LDWGGHFEAWYLKTAPTFGGPTPKGPLHAYHDIEEWLDCTYANTRKLIEQFNQCKDHFPKITPYDHAVEYVTRLKTEGFSFVAITACSKDYWTHDARRTNLEKYFPGVFDTIHCVGLGQPKTEFLERYKPTWWIDDKVKHAEDGGAGNLDHAIADANLYSKVKKAFTWHINADEPTVLDYNEEPKDSRVTQTTSLRSSAAHHRRSVEAISQRVAKILPDVL
jgi:hypothetical protein